MGSHHFNQAAFVKILSEFFLRLIFWPFAEQFEDFLSHGSAISGPHVPIILLLRTMCFSGSFFTRFDLIFGPQRMLIAG